jgi:hypothetical protein
MPTIWRQLLPPWHFVVKRWRFGDDFLIIDHKNTQGLLKCHEPTQSSWSQF